MRKINKYVFSYFFKYKIRLFLYFLIVFIVGCISVFTPYLTGKFIDILTYYKDFNKIVVYSFIFFIVTVLKMILDFFNQRLYINIQMKLSYDMICDLIRYFQKLPYLFTQRFESSYITQRINVDVNKLLIGYLSLISSVISNTIFTVFSLVLIGSFNLYLAILMIIVSILYYIFYYMNKEKIYNISLLTDESTIDFFEKSNLQVNGIKDIKINVIFNELKENMDSSFGKLLFNSLKKQKIDFLYDSIDSLIMLFMQIVIFIYGGLKVYRGELTIGSFTIISMLFSNIISSISFYFNLGQDITELKASLSRINYFYNRDLEENGDFILEDIDVLELKNLQFSYEENLIFDEFNYRFVKNEIYLIKGMNGSGKTTLINLILGLFVNEYKGNISYNRVNIEDIDLYHLRKNLVSVVSQEFLILQHVKYDYKIYDINIIKSLCNMFELEYAFEFYTDYFKIKDITLSRGQFQKIALIISLSKKAKLFILDEPTSALDYESKKKLFKILNENKRDKIFIVVTHDNTLNKITDNIIKI